MATATDTSDAAGDFAGWALLGGGLLLVAGGTAFALSRRPKRRATERDGYVVAETVSAPGVVAPVVVTPEPQVSVQRVRAAPTYAATARAITTDDRHAALEAMVAEAPSEANPFHSRRNRLRRADFLLRTGQLAPAAAEPGMARDTVRDSATSTDRWSETRVGQPARIRVNWKPSTSH